MTKQINKLYLARIERGLSLRDVAAALDVDHKAVLYWERGSRVPEPRNIMKLSNLYQMTPLEIKGAVGDRSNR